MQWKSTSNISNMTEIPSTTCGLEMLILYKDSVMNSHRLSVGWRQEELSDTSHSGLLMKYVTQQRTRRISLGVHASQPSWMDLMRLKSELELVCCQQLTLVTSGTWVTWMMRIGTSCCLTRKRSMKMASGWSLDHGDTMMRKIVRRNTGCFTLTETTGSTDSIRDRQQNLKDKHVKEVFLFSLSVFGDLSRLLWESLSGMVSSMI